MASSRNPEEVFRASPGRTHYTRLTRLLISGGTTILRELFNSIHPPANLSTVLTSSTVSSTLKQMKRNRFLTLPQWKILFPSTATCGQSKTFDITLLCKLFREICNLTAPATGWDSLPICTDLSLTADLARIKYFRNEIYGHVNEDMELRDEEFVGLWNEIKDALVRIIKHYAPSGSSLLTDWENAIENLLTAPLTHEDEIHLEELQHWYLEDMEVRKTLEKNTRTTEETRRTAEDTRTTTEECRIATEETRRTAEETRRTAEDTRRTAEDTRRTAEDTRTTTEESRIATEETRRTAEETRRATEETRIATEETRDLLRSMIATGIHREGLQQSGVQAQQQEQGLPLYVVQQQLQQPQLQVQDLVQGPRVHVQHQVQGPLVQQQLQQPLAQDLVQPEVVIQCLFELASGGLWLSANMFNMNQYTSTDDLEALKTVINRVALPTAAFVYKIVFGSIHLFTKATSLDALTELWKRYKEGQLKTDLEKVFITKQLIAMAQCDVKLIVKINETEYWRARQQFQKQAMTSLSRGLFWELDTPSLAMTSLSRGHFWELGTPSLVLPDDEKYDAFICYAKKDIEFAREILKRLESEPYHLKLCIDYRDILPGADNLGELAHIIEDRCRKIVVILSEHFNNEETADFQAKIALNLSPGCRDKRLIPIKYEPTRIPTIYRFITHLDYTNENAREKMWLNLARALGYTPR